MKKLLLLALLVVGCEDNDNFTSQSSEIDIDWILIRVPDMGDWGEEEHYSNKVGFLFFCNSPQVEFTGTSSFEFGMSFNTNYFTDVDDELHLSFSYNNENFLYNINEITFSWQLQAHSGFGISNYRRIIYNQDMNYLTLFQIGTDALDGVNLLNSFEIIDYR